jgi:Raf kinase inhibitor-like YbhB/YbcL family protein
MRSIRSLREKPRLVGTFFFVTASMLLAAMGGSAMAQGQGSGFQITSPDIQEGKPIPKKFTCESVDVSPTLNWSGAPEGTESYALIMEDPDAPIGTFVHWVLYNIPGDASGLPEGVPQEQMLKDGSVQGLSDFRRVGYNGPCPPPGKPHRYYFILRALDTGLDLPPRVMKREVEKAVEGHVLGEATLMGTFKR